MTPDLIPVFLNGRPCHVRPGATLAQVVAEHEPALLAGLTAGSVKATDARGLPVEAGLVLVAGAVVRVFQSARVATDHADA